MTANAKGRSQGARDPAVGSPKLGARRRILIVEDEFLVALDAEQTLNDLGCEVVGVASRINEALRMIQDRRPDAVLLDLNLRGERAYPVAEALTKQRIPFVFATGYAEDERLQSEYRDHPRVLKPYDKSALRRHLLPLLAPG